MPSTQGRFTDLHQNRHNDGIGKRNSSPNYPLRDCRRRGDIVRQLSSLPNGICLMIPRQRSHFLHNLRTRTGTFLLGTILAASGWLLTHYVDTVISVPTIEYKYFTSTTDTDGSISDIFRTEVQVRNMSRHHKFENLDLIFRFTSSSDSSQNCKFTEARIKGVGSSYETQLPDWKGQTTVIFHITGLHPESALILTAKQTCGVTPTLQIRPTSTPVRLVEQGVHTWLIRHYIYVLLTILILWTATVAMTFFLWPVGASDAS